MPMSDVFKEQIVKREQTIMDTIKRVGVIIATMLISMIGLMFGQFFGPIIAAAAVFGAWFILGRLRQEFEYTFTAGELDIDVIYNRSRRKRVFSARVSDIEVMIHVDDRVNDAPFQNANVIRDYSSGVNGPDTYAFMINYENKRTKVIIEPNEVMLKAMAGVLTRRKLHVRV